jgi:hypothetical protein
MFGFDYDEAVTVRRPKKGTLNLGGRPEMAQLLHSDDESAVRVMCRIEERGRITIDARQRDIKTDATLIYSPDGLAAIEKDDIIVRSGHRTYEVVGIETVKDQWGVAFESRVDLVKTAIAVQEDRRG